MPPIPRKYMICSLILNDMYYFEISDLLLFYFSRKMEVGRREFYNTTIFPYYELICHTICDLSIFFDHYFQLSHLLVFEPSVFRHSLNQNFNLRQIHYFFPFNAISKTCSTIWRAEFRIAISLILVLKFFCSV